MERFLLLPVRLPLPLLHPMRSSRVVRRLTAQSLAPPVRNKTSKTKKKSTELQENASAILETELVSADNSASASGTTMLPTETKVKKPSLKASTGRNASKDRKGETIHSSERGSSGADDTTLRIDKLSTTTEISEEPKLNVSSEAESSSMDKQPSEILQRRRKPPVKAVEPSEKPSPDLSSGDASRLPLENVATRRKQSLDSLSVENTPLSLRGPSELTENSAAAISSSSKKKRLVSSDKLSKDGSIASRETVSVESSLSLDKASGRKKKKSEEAIPRLDPQMASLTSEPTRKVLSVEVKELSLSSSSSDSALSSFVEETIPNSPDIASTQLSNSLLKKARKFPITKQHTVYASPRSRKRAAVAKTPSVGIVEAAKEIDVSKLKHSSFQEVRTVENSVDKASLMESTPSSFSDIHTLNVDAFPRRERTSLLLDGSASNAPTAQPHVGGEISVSKSDSISHQNFKAERANTKLVEYFATDSSADRQTIKLQSAPVEGARVEGLSLHPSRSLSSMEEISVNQIKKVRSSQNRVLLKKGAEEIHREPNNPLSLAEETASLDLQKAYSKMRSPSTFPTEKQSQRVPVPKAEFSANVERAEGKIKTAPRQLSIRKVVANQASTISYMQIYGTGLDTGDTVPTVLLFFDRRRFIFNAGEGLHRFCIEHKFKLSKIDHIFVTRVCSETTSGLPGLLLTLAGLGDSGMTVWKQDTD